jgi:hypothetical protein
MIGPMETPSHGDHALRRLQARLARFLALYVAGVRAALLVAAEQQGLSASGWADFCSPR